MLITYTAYKDWKLIFLGFLKNGLYLSRSYIEFNLILGGMHIALIHERKAFDMTTPVIQEEPTGCGIASVANILGKTYSQMKTIANEMGIHATDQSLWSDTQYVRRMLSASGVETSSEEVPFVSWEALPDLALLAIKYHQEEGKDFWHWVVFKRERDKHFVLDSASYLPSNIRTDFNEMKPQWFIEVKQ